MRTGAHTVREMTCIGCNTYVGWKIVQAHETSERWKNGAYILERELLVMHVVVEGDEYDEQRRWNTTTFTKPPLKLKVIDDLQRRNKPLPRRPLIANERTRTAT